MLDYYLKRKDVLEFIELIKKSPKFHKKKTYEKNSFGKVLDNELALYVFYDALYKYKLLVDDKKIFGFYFDQIQKFYLKMDYIDDISFGIHRTLCTAVCYYLNIVDVLENKNSREKVIRYVYQKYILEGYYVHGFSTVYESSIKKDGFLSEIYMNYYNAMKKIQDIFRANGIKHVMNKDFTNNTTYLTDDLVMGCYYSSHSPGFFYNLLYNEDAYGKDIDKSGYTVGNYNKSIKYLKKKVSSFGSVQSKYIMDVCKKQWDYLNSVPKKISLLLVRRDFIKNNRVRLDEFLKMKSSIYEVVDSILCSKNSKIAFNEMINEKDIIVVSLDDYYDVSKSDEKVSLRLGLKKDFGNAYGVASICLLVGSLAISLGVLVTIFTIVRGK